MLLELTTDVPERGLEQRQRVSVPRCPIMLHAGQVVQNDSPSTATAIDIGATGEVGSLPALGEPREGFECGGIVAHAVPGCHVQSISQSVHLAITSRNRPKCTGACIDNPTCAHSLCREISVLHGLKCRINFTRTRTVNKGHSIYIMFWIFRSVQRVLDLGRRGVPVAAQGGGGTEGEAHGRVLAAAIHCLVGSTYMYVRQIDGTR